MTTLSKTRQAAAGKAVRASISPVLKARYDEVAGQALPISLTDLLSRIEDREREMRLEARVARLRQGLKGTGSR
jgi:hypothetical protein